MSYINISQRAYQYIRQFTIKSVNDGLIELITNSVDAYNKLPEDVFLPRNIWIRIIDSDTIKVIDNAIGLTAEGLNSCFLQVGNYTADTGSRGFFSRGAKDISALGDLTFDTIKDGLYSQCTITTDTLGILTVENIPATDIIREQIGILDNHNGLCVTIKLLPNFQNVNIESLYQSLCNISQLRDINSNLNNNIFLSNNNGFNSRISYTYPPAKLLLDLQYEVPNYTNYTARFVIYQTDVPIPQPVKENEMQFGFLIKDSTSVYEVTTLDNRFRWNPYINYIYGYLYSDGIHDLLLDYDQNGASSKNPYPILDPSRVTGVNQQHPFVINMLSIPLVRLDYILRQLNTSISNGLITIDDINDLLDELADLGLNIMNQNNITVNFNPSYDDNLVKAIQDERANYVISETSYIMNNKYTLDEKEITNYILEQIEKLDPLMSSENGYIMTQDNVLVQIPNLLSTTDINDPVNILSLIPTENDIIANPYIYQVVPNSTGKSTLQKLYIFDKGSIELSSEGIEPITTQNKMFNIQFINDLNIPKRYNIDYTSGVNIQLNINNPTINNYLVKQPIQNQSTVLQKLMSSSSSSPQTINLSNYTSTQSLTFLQELFIEILSHLVVDNDISNGKLILDSGSSYNDAQRVLNHRNSIVSNIENSVGKIFQKYISNNISNKITSISQNINAIADQIVEVYGSNSELTLSKDQLVNLISSIVE